MAIRTLCLPAILACFMSASLPVWAGDGLLWRVSGEQGAAWLLGSVHYASESLYPLPEHVQRAFDGSDSLVLEINIGELTPDAMQDAVNRHATLGPDERLEDLLPGDVLDALAEAGVGIAPYQRFRPWYLAVTLESQAARDSGLAWQEGLDSHFMDMARERSMPVLELETLEQQMTLYRAVGLEGELQLLRNILAVRPEFATVMERVFEWWKAGDVEGLLTFLADEFPQNGGNDLLYDKMIRDRNQGMARGVAEMLGNGGNYFVVVGALHLVGPDGVPSLLAAQGYAVERVLASGPVPLTLP